MVQAPLVESEAGIPYKAAVIEHDVGSSFHMTGYHHTGCGGLKPAQIDSLGQVMARDPDLNGC